MADPIDIAVQFFAVGLGAFLGFIFGMLLEKRNRSNEKNEILKSTVNSLIRELEINETELKKAGRTSQADKFDPYLFLTSAYESSINSGSFSSLNITIQQQLQKLYSNIDKIKKNEEYVLLLLTPLFLVQDTKTKAGIRKSVDNLIQEARDLGADSISLLLAARPNLRNLLEK